MIRRNPSDGVKIPMARPVPLVYWSPAEAQAFLAATPQHRDHVLWRFMLDSGVRVGEALALRWADIDLIKRVVAIRRTVTIGPDKRPTIGADTKTPASRRVISISAATAAALSRHRIQQLERRLETGGVWHDLDLVFDRGDGDIERKEGMARRLDTAVAKAGLPRITPHGFRRTMTVTWLLAGESPRVISDRLGHRSSAFTLDVYAAVSADWQSAATDRVARFLDDLANAQ
jgi:integrase